MRKMSSKVWRSPARLPYIVRAIHEATTGSPRPRRSAMPKPRKKVRLDLKRRPEPEPQPEVDVEKKSKFWTVVAFVALLHLLVIGIGCLIYQMSPAPKPPEQFISLLPEGDVVKGTAGAQEAHKLGPTTAAPTVHRHTAATPPRGLEAADSCHAATEAEAPPCRHPRLSHCNRATRRSPSRRPRLHRNRRRHPSPR